MSMVASEKYRRGRSVDVSLGVCTLVAIEKISVEIRPGRQRGILAWYGGICTTAVRVVYCICT